jgi:glyoxylase-like metal-dependent hydrolase (beta-lactamase superfamily II)
MDKALNTPVTAFFVDGGGTRILVDTGMASTEISNSLHVKGSLQPDGYAIHDQLKKIGIQPQQIDIIVLTHLHWDHYYNIDKFPNAKLYVQKTEWNFSHNPTPTYYRIYEHPKWNRTPQYAGIEQQFELLNGETEILPGISVYPSPGHSVGHQTVVVRTKKGEYHLCGDLVFLYENLRPIPSLFYEISPPNRYVDLPAIWNSIVELKRRAGSEEFILPCHDPAMETLYRNNAVLGN